MKIIFSRKGFDSSAGGFPSLIFPDGTMFSIPIPSSKERYLYKDLDFSYQGESIQHILNDVTKQNIVSSKNCKACNYLAEQQSCHYDPMYFDVPKFQGIALGQAGSAEGHLRNQNIGKGDIFLFYGWFKPVDKINGYWTYVNTVPDIHVIWSYMKIKDYADLDTNEQQTEALLKHPFLSTHPHIGDQRNMKNRIYLSDDYGYFSYNHKRCLTDLESYKGRATWRLPLCFNQPDAFSYLKDFHQEQDDVIITYRGYGQEFVLNLDKLKSDKDRQLIDLYLNEIAI